jgi:hypothetical protein
MNTDSHATLTIRDDVELAVAQKNFKMRQEKKKRTRWEKLSYSEK